MKHSAAALAIATVVGGTGCYYYGAVDPASLEPEGEVRLILSDNGPRHLATGTLNGHPTLSGRLLRWSDQDVTVQIEPVQKWMLTPTGGEPPSISVPRSSIVSVEVKRLDGRKTALVVGGLALGTALYLRSRLGSTGGQGARGGQLPGDDASVASPRVWGGVVVWR